MKTAISTFMTWISIRWARQPVCRFRWTSCFRAVSIPATDFLREPKDIASYAALAAIAIQSNQNDQHGGQSIPLFDYYLAPGVMHTFKKNYRQAF